MVKDQPLILVCEDNADMNQLICGLLTEYNTESAFDGEEALEKAVRLHPDLILMDIMMPKMSGEQLVRAVRNYSELSEVPVIVITARADDDLRVKLLSEGAQDYINKPFRAEELRARIGNLVQRKLAEEKANKSLHQLIQASKLASVGQLASGVAHEINNPLQAIFGNLDNIKWMLKKNKNLKKDLPALVNEMEVATRRCQEIIKGLLDLGKPAVSHQEKVHIEEAIREALMLTHPELDKAHIKIEKKYPAHLPSVEGSHRELMQVFVNFITNSIRAMTDSQEKYLRISSEVKDGSILISFEDTGRGIEKETLPKIFEPFFTTSYKEGTPEMKGTGLGLSICQKIVEEHHGKIEIESEVKKGSIFTVVLPILS